MTPNELHLTNNQQNLIKPTSAYQETNPNNKTQLNKLTLILNVPQSIHDIAQTFPSSTV